MGLGWQGLGRKGLRGAAGGFQGSDATLRDIINGGHVSLHILPNLQNVQHQEGTPRETLDFG